MGDERLPSSGPGPVLDPGRSARMEKVVRANFKFVFHLLRRLGLTRLDAEDGAQRVFMMLLQQISSIRPGGEQAVAYALSRGVAANVRRMTRRHKIVRVSQRRVDKAPCPRPRAPELTEACELLDEVLASMPLELRVVFILSELEQKPAPEIASLQGLPLGTVTSRLRRAKALFLQNARVLSALPDEKGER
jgi:RNA polymerase sigma-70 factor, ECF subfamily